MPPWASGKATVHCCHPTPSPYVSSYPQATKTNVLDVLLLEINRMLGVIFRWALSLCYGYSHSALAVTNNKLCFIDVLVSQVYMVL